MVGPNPQPSVENGLEGRRLDSWKEIAAYLRRDLKTVQRWERDLGLPVHRLFHTQRARVYAYAAELDDWAKLRSGDKSQVPPVTSDETSPVAADSAPPADRRYVYARWAAVAAGIVAAVAYLGVGREAGFFNAPAAKELRPIPFTSSPGAEDHPAISPDGKQIAYVAANPDGGGDDVYVQLVGSHAPLRLTHSADQDHSLAWSPDGTEIVFLRSFAGGNQVLRVSALGGTETVLTQVEAHAEGVSWGADNDLLAFVDSEGSGAPASDIFLFSFQDGVKRRLTGPTAGGPDCCPKFDPAGRRLAYLRRDANRAEIRIASLDGGDVQVIQSDARGIAWTPDGEGLVFSASSLEGGGPLHRVNLADGRIESLGVGGDNTMRPDIRAGRLAYTRWALTSNIWSVPLEPGGGAGGSPAARIISSSRRQYAPDFSPDGEWIAFGSDRSGFREIWVSDKTGGRLRMLTELAGPSVGSPRWSPDGQWIAFDSNKESSADIYLVSSAGGVPRRVTVEPATDIVPAWSHDGEWLFFVSDRSGERQIWKIPTGGGEAVQVTRNGGFESRASRDGRYLYYAADKQDEIRRLRLGDGKDEVIPELSGIGRVRRYWTLSEGGIYFARADQKGNATSFVEFFRFSDRRVVRAVAVDNPLFDSSAGLAVSPDGGTLLYVLKEQDERDIMLVEGFE